eukprot:scaffold61869_cov28-Tisochrysis_lutea.AAC.1
MTRTDGSGTMAVALAVEAQESLSESVQVVEAVGDRTLSKVGPPPAETIPTGLPSAVTYLVPLSLAAVIHRSSNSRIRFLSRIFDVASHVSSSGPKPDQRTRY